MLQTPLLPSKRPTRAVAFAIHLTLSLLAFSTLVLVMLLFWFPGELFLVDGGLEGLKLVAMVDLVLGPALTLILYKPDKPRVMMDMSCIAAVQIVALAYGFYTTYSQRTVAVVYAENSFSTISASDHQQANAELQALDIIPGQIEPARTGRVPMVLATTPADYGQFLKNLLNGYPALRERSDLYRPIADARAQMTAGRLSQDQLDEIGMLASVQKSLHDEALDLQSVEIYRYQTRYSSGVVVFDPLSLAILDFVPFEPDSETLLARNGAERPSGHSGELTSPQQENPSPVENSSVINAEESRL